jgi:hypothetical protein
MKSRLIDFSLDASSAHTLSTFLRRDMSAWRKVGCAEGLMLLMEAMAASAADWLRPMR